MTILEGDVGRSRSGEEGALRSDTGSITRVEEGWRRGEDERIGSKRRVFEERVVGGRRGRRINGFVEVGIDERFIHVFGFVVYAIFMVLMVFVSVEHAKSRRSFVREG